MPVIQPANGARSASTERANELIISASRFAQSGQKQRQTNNKPIATVCQYISQEGSRGRVWHNKPLSLFNKNCEQISESTHESTRWTPDENVPSSIWIRYTSARDPFDATPSVCQTKIKTKTVMIKKKYIRLLCTHDARPFAKMQNDRKCVTLSRLLTGPSLGRLHEL